jgi:hypothetical protein
MQVKIKDFKSHYNQDLSQIWHRDGRELMNEAEFWQMIDKTREASRGDPKKQLDLLVDELAPLPTEEIVSFDRFVDIFLDRAYDWDLWAAAYIIDCGCGDDSFSDFGSWLIAQGKTVFEQALADPESLTDVVDLNTEPFLENLGYAGFLAYERKTGLDKLPSIGEPLQRTGLTGDKWDEDTVYEKYPRLAAKFKDACDRLF